MLYYIHGYQSDPKSTKGTLFKEKLNATAIQYRDCKPEDLIIADCLKRISDVIKDDENNGDWGISLSTLSKQNNIVENLISNNYGGIKLSGVSEQNEVMDNVISDNDLEGLLIEGLSIGNTIEGNNITNNFGGIKLSASGQNIINENNIEENSMEGILLETSNSNIITKNNFIGNKRQAKYLFSSRNSWEENYWDNWIGLIFESPIFKSFPKIIKGIFLINIDANPALEPYEI